MSGFVVNPSAPALWSMNAVLNGRARHVASQLHVGTLSMKTVRSGNATWMTPEGRYTVTPESFLVLNDGQSYELEIDCIEPTETFCVFFRKGFVGERRPSGATPGFYERLGRMTPEIRTALSRLSLLMSEGAAGSLEGDDALAVVADELLAMEIASAAERDSLSLASPAAREEVMRLLNRARDFMLQHVDLAPTLEEIAVVACMSPFHFHKLHAQAFRETPHEFLTRLRIERARRLLREGYGVAEVAIELGFASIPSFTRLFRTRVGVTPGSFRKIG